MKRKAKEGFETELDDDVADEDEGSWVCPLRKWRASFYHFAENRAVSTNMAGC